MKMPGADPTAVALFESLCPEDSTIEVRKMFGQPAAFLGGNLVFGVFGADVFVRLSEAECAKGLAEPGMRAFEPMSGRAMKGYLVLSPSVRAEPARARTWVGRAVRYVRTLPPKAGKRKTPRGRPAP